MTKWHFAAAIVVAASVLNPAPAAGEPCCGGPPPPTPAQLRFISDMRGVGLYGAQTTTMMTEYGPTPIGKYPTLNVGDANILVGGFMMCSFLGIPSEQNSTVLRRIYFLVGEPWEPADGYHPRIGQAFDLAKAQLC